MAPELYQDFSATVVIGIANMERPERTAHQGLDRG